MSITAQQIKDIICPKGTNPSFISKILEPLCSADYPRIVDQYGFLSEHMSEVMNGNGSNKGKRYGTKYFIQWAAAIEKTEKLYWEIVEIIKEFEPYSMKQRRDIRKLFKTDKDDMPDWYAAIIDGKLNKSKDSEAVFLLFLWSTYGKQLVTEVLSFLTRLSEPVDFDGIQLLPHIVPANPVYIARDNLLERT